uniref:NADH-ubiquinone oxidoreductase chain 4L n=1 Tax=Dinophilus gyrociliatus TaxID=120995 RepID=A0A343TAQ7_9ANNE|nr:NADH dehydrogenase subunit 4L [Dinophilus gyrociliatus]
MIIQPHELTLMISLVSISSIIIMRNKLLMCLLSLEASILSLTLMLSFTLSSTSTMYLIIPMFILAFGACEASVALAILVLMSRLKGNDLISSMSFNNF